MPKIVHLNNIENVKNKTNIIDKDSTSEQYPSAKAVYEMLSSMEPGGGTSDASCSNTFIEEGVSTWAELNDILAAYDKNFMDGGSVTVNLTDSFFGVAGYYNIKRMMDTIYDYVAVDISNPAKNVYKFNRKNYTYEFIGNESFELEAEAIELSHLSADLKTHLLTSYQELEINYNVTDRGVLNLYLEATSNYKMFKFKFTSSYPDYNMLGDDIYLGVPISTDMGAGFSLISVNNGNIFIYKKYDGSLSAVQSLDVSQIPDESIPDIKLAGVYWRYGVSSNVDSKEKLNDFINSDYFSTTIYYLYFASSINAIGPGQYVGIPDSDTNSLFLMSLETGKTYRYSEGGAIIKLQDDSKMNTPNRIANATAPILDEAYVVMYAPDGEPKEFRVSLSDLETRIANKVAEIMSEN